MDLNGLRVFNMLKSRMNWLQERQKVVSENVANADTPGFKAKDLKALTFKERMANLPLADTSPSTAQGASFIAIKPSINRGYYSETKANDYETSPVGNSVVLEEQMMKSAETQNDYDTMSNLYKKQVGLLKLALGGPR